MVAFELSEEERMVQQVAHEFAKKEIRPVAAHFDEREETPYEVIKKAAAIGLGVSSEGGLSEGMSSSLLPSIIAEELAWGCAGIALAINSSGLAAAAIAATGSAEQRARWLAEIASDANTVKLGAMCLTEPDAGSDVANIQTTATRDGDDYVLNGEKQFITNGGIADLHVVFATEDRSKGWGGLGAYVVPRGTPGLEQGTVWRKMGIRASHTANVVLNNCRIPAAYKLGGGGGAGGAGGGPGALGALMTLERTRPVVGAYALGIGRAAYEYALDYAKQRVQFGRPIIKNQGISFMLADMAMAVDSARLMVWRAAWMAGANAPYLQAEGSMAKCFASDMAMKVTVDAVQVLGGQGYMRDHPVEKWVRDAKIFQIFEGTNQIQRMVIGRALEALPPRG
jgi:acyl-CoA dehydrogenase